jgi:hypothetical protein
MAGPRRAGAGLAIAGDRAIDDVGPDGADVVIAEAEPGHDARPELLDDDVGALDQRAQPRARGLVLQVQRHAFLATVEHGEIGAVGAPFRAVGPHLLAAAGALDLDDLRAGLGKEQSRHRPRQERAEVEHGDARQRAFRHRPFSRAFATTARRAGM